MIHLRLGRVLVPLLILAAVPACAKKPPSGEPPTPAVVVADPAPEDAGAIPPPRPVLPAAEPSDAEDALEVFVVAGENGTWKFEHPSGVREVNELHLPVGRAVRLWLTSENAGARPFEIPAFPLAIDAVGGRYTQTAVVPRRAGEFGIWSGRERVGTAVVVTAAEFESWLQGTGVLHGDKSVDGSPAHQGRQLFLKLNCIKCHTAKADSQAPNLEGLFGRKEKLRGGEAVVVDEAYVVESIRKPRAKVVDGWEPIMPAYEKDVVSEKEVQALVAYIKSLKPGDAKAKEERFPPPVGAPTEPRREIAPPPREKPGG